MKSRSNISIPVCCSRQCWLSQIGMNCVLGSRQDCVLDLDPSLCWYRGSTVLATPLSWCGEERRQSCILKNLMFTIKLKMWEIWLCYWSTIWNTYSHTQHLWARGLWKAATPSCGTKSIWPPKRANLSSKSPVVSMRFHFQFSGLPFWAYTPSFRAITVYQHKTTVRTLAPTLGHKIL